MSSNTPDLAKILSNINQELGSTNQQPNNDKDLSFSEDVDLLQNFMSKQTAAKTVAKTPQPTDVQTQKPVNYVEQYEPERGILPGVEAGAKHFAGSNVYLAGDLIKQVGSTKVGQALAGTAFVTNPIGHLFSDTMPQEKSLERLNLLAEHGLLNKNVNPDDVDNQIKELEQERENVKAKNKDAFKVRRTSRPGVLGVVTDPKLIGLDVEEQTAKANEADAEIRSITNYIDALKDLRSFQKQGLTNEQIFSQAKTAEQYKSRGDRLMEKGQKISESAPQGEGFWFEFGNMIPQTAGLAASIAVAPFSGGASLAIGTAYTTSLAGSAAGSFMMEYDRYHQENGLIPDELHRYGGAALSAVSEFAFERIRLDKALNPLFKKMIAKEIASNPKFLEKGVGILEMFKKQRPDRWKVIQKGLTTAIKEGNDEGIEEMFTEIAQHFLANSYKDEKDKSGFDELAGAMFQAYRGGMMMGSFLGPVKSWSNSQVNRIRRNEHGMNLGMDKEGNVFELLQENNGKIVALDKEGKQVTIDKSIIIDQVNMTPQQANEYLDAFQKQDADLKQMEKEVKLDNLKQKHSQIATSLQSKDTPGTIEVVQDGDGKLFSVVSRPDANSMLVVNVETGESKLMPQTSPTQTFKEVGTFTIDQVVETNSQLEFEQSEQAREQAEQTFTPGQEIDYNGGKYVISAIAPDGKLIAEQLLEDGSMGESIEILPQDQQNIAAEQSIKNEAKADLDAIAQETGLKETQEASDQLQQKVEAGGLPISLGESKTVAIPNNDGTYTIENQFNSMEEADQAVAELNKKFNRRGFEFFAEEKLQDHSNPFSDATYFVHAKPIQSQQAASKVENAEQQAEVKTEPVKQEVKQETPAKESEQAPQQETNPLADEQLRVRGHNRLIGLTEQHNRIPVSHTNKRSALMRQINNMAAQLGYQIAHEGKNNKGTPLMVVKSEGKKIKRIAEKTSKEEVDTYKTIDDYTPEVQQFMTNVMDNAELIILNPGYNWGMSEKEKVQAIKNIKDRKKTVAAKRLLDELESIHQKGGMDLTSPDGQTAFWSIEEMFVAEELEIESPVMTEIEKSEDDFWNNAVDSFVNNKLTQAEVDDIFSPTNNANQENLTNFDHGRETDTTDQSAADRGVEVQNTAFPDKGKTDLSSESIQNDSQSIEGSQQGQRLSEYKLGDFVTRTFKGGLDEGKVYKIRKANSDIWELEEQDTGYITKWNALNNGGFILATPEQVKQEKDKFTEFKKESQKQEEKLKEAIKAEKQEYVPKDGWRDNLFKAREYLRALISEEAITNLRGSGLLDWTNAGDIVYHIDQILLEKQAKQSEIKKEESKVNIDPSEAQKEAGNYQKGHITLHGLEITIENPKGSKRKGISPDGTPWENTIQHTYGYFKRTEGRDGDQIDTFIGDNPTSQKVFIVDQVKENKAFDEHKVLLGFNSLEEAKQGYLANYEPGWDGIGAITEMTIDEFKSWMGTGTRKMGPVGYGKTPTLNTTITAEDIKNFPGLDANQRQFAIDFLNGDTSIMKKIVYSQVENRILKQRQDELNSSTNLQRDSQTGDNSSSLAKGTVSNDTQTNSQAGGKAGEGVPTESSGAVDTTQQDQSKSTEGDKGSIPDDASVSGKTGDQQMDKPKQGSLFGNDVPTGDQSDTAGDKHTTGRRSPGSKGIQTDRTGDTTDQRDTDGPRGESKPDLDSQLDDALASLKNNLDRFKKAGRGEISSSLFGLTNEQIEVLGDLIVDTGRIGRIFAQKGYTQFAEWLKQMKEYLGEIFAASGLDEGTIDDILSQAWTTPFVDDAGNQVITKDIASKIEAEKNNNNEVVIGDLESIGKTVPKLFPEQREDVQLAEKRFFIGAGRNNKTGNGILFTNGTGTGKTYVGLGIAKRFALQGKKNILIVVPTQTKSSDWIEEGGEVGFKINVLKDTTDSGDGPVVTTYANFRLNQSLESKEWDLIIYDESHYMNQNEGGNSTAILEKHRDLANLPTMARQKAKEKIAGPIPIYPTSKDATDLQISDYYERLNAWNDKVRDNKAEIEKEFNRLIERTKVVFLSASPFAYHKNLSYGDGTLFEINEIKDYNHKQVFAGAYNAGQAWEKFMMQHFGYRMRYNKLTSPERDVDQGLMERQFFENMVKEGIISGRQLELDYDYSRDFLMVEPGVGKTIDEALELLYSREFSKRFPNVVSLIKNRFNFLYTSRLLEALKARQIIPVIKEFLAKGQKVLVYHNYNEGTPRHPFNIGTEQEFVDTFMYFEGRMSKEDALLKEYRDFHTEYSYLVNLDLHDLINPIATLSKEFGERAGMFNGTIPQKLRKLNIQRFNTKDSGLDVMIVQKAAGKEGISLHDTKGDAPRVKINLGLPTAPTDAIQIEGRIYRVGQKSNAAFIYPVIHTSFERFAFAHKVAERASTAENLAMGEKARALRDSFKNGYLSPIMQVDWETIGTGGRETDKALYVATEFDRAKTFYFGTQKKTAKNKSAEGKDYFATPEPVGFKMVEWLGLKPNEAALEPSAGHGAIGRFFPETTYNVFVEPSYELRSILSSFASGNVRGTTFEDFHIVNKFHGIAMNPPFGSSGKTAMDHLEKAFEHLKENGRVVAIIPSGPSMEKRLEKFLYGQDENGKSLNPEAVLRAEINLPGVTFARAGTGVHTKIVVVDRVSAETQEATPIEPATKIDLSAATTIQELFDRIEHITIPERLVEVKGSNIFAGNKVSNMSDLTKSRDALIPSKAEQTTGQTGEKADLFIQNHSKTGKALPTVTLKERVSKEEFLMNKQLAKSLGGYWSSYKGEGMKPGFIFETEDKAKSFLEKVSGEDTTTRQRVTSITKEKLSPRAIKFHARLAEQTYGVNVKVVNNRDALPNAVKERIDPDGNTSGVFVSELGQDGKYTDTVYIIANEVANAEELQKTILHEIVAHKGMRDLMGTDTFNEFLEGVFENMSDGSKARIAKLYDTTNPLEIAEEYIAEMAESGTIPTWFDKVVSQVREFLRSLGIDLNITDKDIVAMLHRSSENLKHNLSEKEFTASTTDGQTLRFRKISKIERGKNPSLRKLKPGEFSLVERKYLIDKNYEFTGKTKISSYDDVAYLFKNLQTAAVENSFAVYVDKDGKPVIQHLSMGGPYSTLLWHGSIRDGAERFGAKDLYFVHNHPSGNLTASGPDFSVLQKIKDQFPKLNVQGIIINITSGKYLLMGDIYPTDMGKAPSAEESKKHKVLRFDKQIYRQDIQRSKITSPSDAAEILSGIRFSNGNKLSMLVLSRSNEVVGNIHLPFNMGSKKSDQIMAEEIAALTVRFGGVNVVLYGNRVEMPGYLFSKKIEAIKAKLKNEEVYLIDYIEVESRVDTTPQGKLDYRSLSEDGRLSESESTYENKINSLSPIQKKTVAEKVAGVNQNIKAVKEKIRDVQGRIISKKKDIEKQKHTQGDLFGSESSKFAGNLFEIKQDFSQENMDRILDPLKAELKRYSDELVSLEGKRDQIIDSIIAGAKAQTELQFRKSRTATEVLASREVKKRAEKIDKVFSEISKVSKHSAKHKVIETSEQLIGAMEEAGASSLNIKQVEIEIQSGNMVDAVYDEQTDTLFIVAENMPGNEKMLKKLWLHEQGVHKGLKLLVPDAIERRLLLNAIFDSIGKERVIEMIGEAYHTAPKHEQAEEYLAWLAENYDFDTITQHDRQIWTVIKEFFAELANKIFGVDIVFTDADIRRIIQASVRKMTSETNTDTDFIGRERKDIAQNYNVVSLFHGTNRKINEFSTLFAGSGEGDSAGGFGTYLTEDQTVALYYAKYAQVNSQSSMEIENRIREEIGESAARVFSRGLFYSSENNESIESFLNKKHEAQEPGSRMKQVYEDVLNFLKENPLKDKPTIYNTSIVKHKSKGEFRWFDLHSPISDKSKEMILRRAGKESEKHRQTIVKALKESKIGEDFIQKLGGLTRNTQWVPGEVFSTPKQASQFMMDAGFDGNVLPVGWFTEKTDTGKYNYIVYDESMILPPSEIRFKKSPSPKGGIFAGEALKKSSELKMINTKGKKAREILQDRMLSVRNLMDVVKQRGGNIIESADPYVQENLATSRFKAEAENFNKEIFDPLMENVAALSKKTGATLDEIQFYMKAKHAPERNEYLFNTKQVEDGSGMSNQEAQKVIKDFESKTDKGTINQFWKAVNQATDYTISKWRDYGFMSNETYQDVKNRWKHYIPLRGWMIEETDDVFDYVEKAGQDGFNFIKKAEGRSTEADDPFHYIVSMAHSAIAAGEKNKVKQAAARMVRNNAKMKDLFSSKVLYYIDTKTKDEKGKTIFLETTEKPDQELWDDGLVKVKLNTKHESRKPREKSKQHEVEVYFNGQKSILVFTDPSVANAINYNNQINPELTMFLQETIGKATRWLSANFTAKNPAFIPINLIRDYGYALASHYIKGDAKQLAAFVKHTPKARRAINRHLADKHDPNNKYDQYYKEFLKEGGETGYVHLFSLDSLKRQVEKEFARLTGTNSKFDKVAHSRLMKSLGKVLENYAVRSENLSRFATFITSREMGDSPQQAAYKAKEITVNFNRKGRATGLLGSLYAFFNAAIQGGQNVLSMGKRHQKKFAAVSAGYMATGFLSAMINDLYGDDDEEDKDGKSYDTLSDFVKYHNLVIPGFGKNKFITIPMPHGFRTFHAFGVMAWQYMSGKRDLSHILMRGVSNIMDSLSVIDATDLLTEEGGLSVRPVVPTAAVPIFDILDNQDFAGRRIYNEAFTKSMEAQTPNSQLGLKNTNKAIEVITNKMFELGGGDSKIRSKHYIDKNGELKQVKDAYDWNPAKAEHLLFYYLGGRGQFWNDVYKTSSSLIESAADVVTGDKEFKEVMKETEVNNLPVVRRLYRSPWTSNYIKEFYKIRDDVEAYNNLVSQLKENGRYEQYIELRQNEKLQLQSKFFEKYEKKLKQIQASIERIEDPQAQKELLNVKDELIRNLVDQVNNLN